MLYQLTEMERTNIADALRDISVQASITEAAVTSENIAIFKHELAKFGQDVLKLSSLIDAACETLTDQ